MTFGESVANRRRELGLSQTDIAKTLGVSVATINKVEHDRTKPNSKTAKKVVELLGLSIPADSMYMSGNTDINLKMIEKRICNAMFELQCILDIVRSMKGELDEQDI